jgi:hypothetical protein
VDVLRRRSRLRDVGELTGGIVLDPGDELALSNASILAIPINPIVDRNAEAGPPSPP